MEVSQPKFEYRRLLMPCKRPDERYARGDPNNVLQNGCQYDVYIGSHNLKKELGFGLIALECIPRGHAVFEYSGNSASLIFLPLFSGRILTVNEANKLEKTSFQFCSDFDENKRKHRVIDAHDVGNASRFTNHSCRPNLELLNAQSFLNSTMSDYGLHRLVMVTKRDIALGKAVLEIPCKGCLALGERLTLDYYPHWSAEQLRKTTLPKTSCECGETNCRKWMPSGHSTNSGQSDE